MEDAVEAHRALSNRARLEIIKLLYRSPMTVEEISKKINLQPITVRHHLRLLEEAGLVSQREVRTGSAGRPSVKYELIKAKPPVTFPTRQYLTLANSLIKAVKLELTEKEAVEVFRRAGFEMGLAAVKKLEGKYDVGEWSLEAFKKYFVEKCLEELGCEPEVVKTGKSAIVYRLHNCIFFELALEEPEITCNLIHSSFNEGVSKKLGGKAKITRSKCLALGDPYCEHVCEWLA